VAEARFRAMFYTAAVGIGIMSLDRRLMDANPALCRLFGMSREELIGKTPEIVTYKGDYSKSSHDFKEMVSSDGNYYEAERRYVRKNGEIFWAHVTMTIVRDSSGKPLYIVGMVVDIDEQKKALAGLQESEARFRAMFEYASLGIVIGDVEKKPIAVNEAMAEMLGYSRQVLLETPGMDVTYPEDKALGQREFSQLAAGEIDSYHIEKRLAHKDGHPVWVRQTVSSVRDPQRKTVYWVSMVENIDARRQTLQDLQESESRFRAMFDNISIGMALVGFDRRVLAANQTLEQLSGYSAQELSRISISDLVYPEDLGI